jgi:tetratricopeptide (TPR) repeat protein
LLLFAVDLIYISLKTHQFFWHPGKNLNFIYIYKKIFLSNEKTINIEAQANKKEIEMNYLSSLLKVSAQCFLELGEYDLSFDHLNEANRILKNLYGKQDASMMDLRKISIKLLLYKRKIDKAKSELDKYLKFLQKSEENDESHDLLKADCYRLASFYYSEVCDSEQCHKFAEDAIVLYGKLTTESIREIAEVHFYTACCYYRETKLLKACEEFDLALKILEKCKKSKELIFKVEILLGFARCKLSFSDFLGDYLTLKGLLDFRPEEEAILLMKLRKQDGEVINALGSIQDGEFNIGYAKLQNIAFKALEDIKKSGGPSENILKNMINENISFMKGLPADKEIKEAFKILDIAENVIKKVFNGQSHPVAEQVRRLRSILIFK